MRSPVGVPKCGLCVGYHFSDKPCRIIATHVGTDGATQFPTSETIVEGFREAARRLESRSGVPYSPVVGLEGDNFGVDWRNLPDRELASWLRIEAAGECSDETGKALQEAARRLEAREK